MDALECRRLIDCTANEINRLVDCGFLKSGIHWIKAWTEFDLKWSADEKPHLTIRASCLDSFVERSVQNPEVFKLAMFFVGTRLKNGISVPEPLLEIASDYLTGERMVPAGASGRKRNSGRDFIIVTVMRQLLDEVDIFATHNRHPKGVRTRFMSASEIVGKALEKSRVHYVTPEQINKIWRNFRKQVQNFEAGRSNSVSSDYYEVIAYYHNTLLDDEDEVLRL